jgi:hypothetical protein
MDAVVSYPHAGATKKYLQDEAALFFVRTKLPLGSRVSILSVAIAVRLIAEYSRLLLQYID